MMTDDSSPSSSSSQKSKRSKLDQSLPLDEHQLLKTAGFSFNFECDAETAEQTLTESDDHTVLFQQENSSASALNSDGKKSNKRVGTAQTIETPISLDEWKSDDFVKLPYYAHNVDENGRCVWTEIVRCLELLADTFDQDADSIHIEYAIKKYTNPKYRNRLYFQHLHDTLDEMIRGGGEEKVKGLLRRMIKLALELPEKLANKPIPILKSNVKHEQSISMTQEQCACLLANCFFCTFASRLGRENPAHLPYVNFNNIFGGASSFKSRHRNDRSNVKKEKIKCLLNYFDRVTSKMPQGVITFTRYSLDENEMVLFGYSDKKCGKVLIKQDGTIEDCMGGLQMDFANKYLGGGVLNSGCVQEEIRFLICPELLASLLFTECLKDNECVVIKGCERFSSYKGYSHTFEFDGNYDDSRTPRDKWNRLYTHVLALDALAFSRHSTQFNEPNINRELTKSYCGFKRRSNIKSSGGRDCFVATGNWGCGAFNGNKQLKFLIQVMSAAEAGRDLVYYTFNDRETFNELNELMRLIKTHELTVASIYSMLIEFSKELHELIAAKKMKKSKSKSLSPSSTIKYDDDYDTDEEKKKKNSAAEAGVEAESSTSDRINLLDFITKKLAANAKKPTTK